MVKRILTILQKEIRGLHEAAYLLGTFALLSQILALVRDRMFAHNFGAGEILDIYYAAFRIPDLIFGSIASLVSLSVLIPFLTERLKKSDSDGKIFLNSVFSVFALTMIVVSGAAFVVVPKLLSIMFPGLVQTSNFHELITLTRILLLQPILLGLSSLLASVVHVYQKFVLYAIAPLLYNIGIIIGILVLYPIWGLAGLGVGVVFGALMHLLIQLPAVIKSSGLPRLRLRGIFKDMKKVIALSLPRTLALSSSQIVLIVLVGLASKMKVGSIAIFNFAFNLQSVPLAIIGVSYSVAAFPTLSKLFSNGDRDKFFSHITTAARHIIFWSIPAIVLFIVLRAQIVRVVLGSGEFSWADTSLTAAALALFSFSLLAQSIVLLFVRGYYAAGKTGKPLAINLISSASAIALAYLFIWTFENNALLRAFFEVLLRVENIEGTKILMLPLSYSFAFIINAALFWVFFQRDFSIFSSKLNRAFFLSFSSSIIMGFTAHFMLDILDDVFDINTFWGILGQGLLSGLAGIVTLVVMLKILGDREVDEVWRVLHKKFWKARVISSE